MKTEKNNNKKHKNLW